jgi:hypothetical protein
MNNIIAFWDKLTYNDILLLIIILCLIVYYIFLGKKQYEGMTNTTPNNLPDIEENNSQILNDIQSLQNIEQELFNSLENQPDLSSTQQEQIVNKINNISNMRVNLYETIGGINDFFKTSLSNSTNTLIEQTKAIEIVEQELNQAKRRLELLEADKNNKIRLVEINNYYGQKYAEHSDLMKIIILMLIPIFILSLLKNKEILPSNIYYILVVFISVFGAFFIWKKMISIMGRDSMNYQEYTWYFDANAAPEPNSATIINPWVSTNINGTCVGEQCCPVGLQYDISMNQCVNVNNNTSSTSLTTSTPITNTTNTTNTTESFIENNLTKYSFNYEKPDVVLGEIPQPINSSKFW